MVRPLESIADRNRAGSRLLFLAEFLETRIVPQRIEHRIEPEQRGSQRLRKAVRPRTVSRVVCVKLRWRGRARQRLPPPGQGSRLE